MALYFFHLRDGADVLLDKEGQELADHSAIVAAALHEARSIIGADALQGTIRLGQRIDVEDERGKIVHEIQFEDAVLIVPRIP